MKELGLFCEEIEDTGSDDIIFVVSKQPIPEENIWDEVNYYYQSEDTELLPKDALESLKQEIIDNNLSLIEATEFLDTTNFDERRAKIIEDFKLATNKLYGLIFKDKTNDEI